MNASDYVDNKDCLKCGRCCKDLVVIYPKIPVNLHTMSLIKRFRLLDTNKIMVEEDDRAFIVTFFFPCKALYKDREGWKCRLYDSKEERPQVCEEFPFKDTPTRYCPYMKTK